MRRGNSPRLFPYVWGVLCTSSGFSFSDWPIVHLLNIRAEFFDRYDKTAVHHIKDIQRFNIHMNFTSLVLQAPCKLCQLVKL